MSADIVSINDSFSYLQMKKKIILTATNSFSLAISFAKSDALDVISFCMESMRAYALCRRTSIATFSSSHPSLLPFAVMGRLFLNSCLSSYTRFSINYTSLLSLSFSSDS